MSGRSPTEIWEDALDEGERRLDRGTVALAVTGMLGGVEVMFGVVAVVVTTAAFSAVMPNGTAHLLGSLTFGLALVFITIGRSELFTENFLIPVSAVYAGRGSTAALSRLWVITLLGNLCGLVLMALVFAPHGVLPPKGLTAAGTISDVYTTRAVVPALLSAVAAGALMTLLTWYLAAAESDVTRVVLSLIGGFVLIAPSLNHAVVGFGEIVFGMIAGTAKASVGDFARTFGLAVAGNLIGGIALITATRLVQVRGEPGSSSGGTARTAPDARRAA
ncbi:MAG TPA: formate/nitrite transporter family protein [Solirubrobacteraceae bacterium]|jgi:formate/nitrite transporter FocA (FNT family)|nr:formate/nitrite transporter family protein [Solirubrobacteraceae bacterium]